MPRGPGPAVGPLRARVDGRAERRPEFCCPLGRPRLDFVFGMASGLDGNSAARTRDLIDVIVAVQHGPAKC